ncbi:MAG: cysteine desulfurase [Thermomicrobiales bacterium]|nr:cysteine desulfurase [Thermomicrobiales bacterium]
MHRQIETDSIYLDHAATTPVDPDVLRAMVPWFTEYFGNPSSIYQLGQQSRAGLDDARARCARVLGCHPSEILFTSGATESNNLALAGSVWARREQSPNEPAPHIVTTAVEHHAVLHKAEWLQHIGFGLTVVEVDKSGIVDPADIERAIRPETALVSVMYANNETGAIQPVADIARVARNRGVPFHTDAVQAAGMLPLSVDELGVDLLSLSAHKFYGPKGVGLLYVRKGTPMSWQQLGGGQESGRRGGTENVPLIAGMGVALQIAERDRATYAADCRALQDQLFADIVERVEGVTLNGPELDANRLPNNLNLTVDGVQGETVLLNLDIAGVAASAGSACTTGNSQPSHVLKAMGFSDERCRTSIRLTVGRCNSADDIADAADALADAVLRIRQLG